jgi:hypothetical protein
VWLASLLLLAVGPAAADEALLVSGGTLTGRALDPLVVLPGGSVDTTRLRRVVAEMVYDDADVLLHDLNTGKTKVVGPEVGARRIVSITQGEATLGEVLEEPGAVALLQTSGGLDAGRAEAFQVFTPTQGPVTYLPEPYYRGRDGSLQDRDEDGVEDGVDNCVAVYNPDQLDTDDNGIGDVCQCGDVNLDGVTNVTDALEIARGEVLSTDDGFGRCDVDGDGTCNVVDALQIARGEVGSLREDQLCPAYLGLTP